MTALYLATNRYNLLEFLSSGLIVPREAIKKYYADPLERAPGRLVLVGAPLPVGVLALTREQTEPTSFPVALELDSHRLSGGKLPSLGVKGEFTNRALGDPAAIAWAPVGAIPLSAVTCVHFASEKDREEHEARQYENIRVSALPARVSPELFARTKSIVTTEVFFQWLSSLPPPQEEDARDWSRLDRDAGALTVLAAALPADARILNAFMSILAEAPPSRPSPREAKRKPKTRVKHVGGLPSWIELTQAGTRLDDAPPAEADLETLLFLATLSVLRSNVPQERWRPLDVLASIEARVKEMPLSEQDKAELPRNLEPIRSILRNERDFHPLNTGKGLLVAKALLLVLLRPEPQRLLAWDRQASGASDAMVMTAAVFSGLLSGHKRLSVELRNEGLDTLLAERAVTFLSSSHGAWAASHPVPQELSLMEVAREDASVSLVLMWRGVQLLSRAKPPPTLADTLISMRLGDPARGELALRIVRLLEWVDCVRTQVNLPAGEYSLKRGKGSSLVLTTMGFPTMTHVVDEVRFTERLVKEGIPQDRDASLWELVKRTRP